MTRFTVGTTPVQIDPGTASSLLIVNNSTTGTVLVGPGGHPLRPGRSAAVLRDSGVATFAVTESDTVTIDVTVTGTYPGATVVPAANPSYPSENLIGTAAQWTAHDLVLDRGQEGIQTGTPGTELVKIGDGATRFSQLPSAGGGGAAYLTQSAATGTYAPIASPTFTTTQTNAPLSSEMLTNQILSTPQAEWTLSGGAVGNVNGTITMTDVSAFTQSVAVVAGTSYQIAVTITSATAGNLTAAIDSVSALRESWNDLNFVLVAASTGTATVSFSTDLGSAFIITAVSMKAITADSIAAATVGAASVRSSASLSTVAVGSGSLRANTTGLSNAAFGVNTLNANATGFYNTAIGYAALPASTTGYSNTAVGASTLRSNVTGYSNNAVGDSALRSNTTGAYNSAVGASAMYSNTSGASNNAMGVNSLRGNTTGTFNNAIGTSALYANTSGVSNCAVGADSLRGNTTGNYNSAMGLSSLYSPGSNTSTANATTTGTYQVGIGYQCGQASATQRTNITCIGVRSLVDGDYATALGSLTHANAAGAVAIGCDHTGAGATTSTQDEIALGTASHKVKISNNATGAGSAALGANCPAVTATAPFTWLKMTAGDGSTVYLPAWK